MLALLAIVHSQQCPPPDATLTQRPWLCEPANGPGADDRGNSDDLSLCLGNGHVVNGTVCPSRWQWYQVATRHWHDVPEYVLETDGAGVTREVRRTKKERLAHAVALHVQSDYCPHAAPCGREGTPEYYTTVNVLVVDGELTHPWTSKEPWGPGGKDPDDYSQFYKGDLEGKPYRYYKLDSKKNVAITFGYHFNNSADCAPKVSDKVNVGIFCSWKSNRDGLKNQPCHFTLRASLIPEKVYDGVNVQLPLSPPLCPAGCDDSIRDSKMPSPYLQDAVQHDPGVHHFRIEVGDFDALNITVLRVGNNLTYPTLTGTGTWGHGIRGHLLLKRGSCPGSPTLDTGGRPTLYGYDLRTNVTVFGERFYSESFCTTGGTSGTYHFALVADDEFGPFDGEGHPLGEMQSAWESKVCEDYAPCWADDNRVNLKLQMAYGFYRLIVDHEGYHDGPMSSGVPRAACVSYGQWRRFTIETAGAADAALVISTDAPISGIYMRAGAAPSETVYDVRSPPGQLRVSGSPCDVVTPTTWHVGLRLATKVEIDAAGEGVAPTKLTMNAMLMDATIDVGGDGSGGLTIGGGGDPRGFVCCGAIRHFRLPDVPEAASLQAVVRLKSGRARALYVKWNRCPVPADIAMDTGECNGFCAVDWLATRGDFSGELYNRSDGAVRVPFGKGDSPDKRRGGAWYVGVQALAGESAEFELSASLYMPQAGGGDACTRYTAACAADSSRGAYLGGAPATPPALVEEDNSMAATMVRRGVPAVAALVGLCLIIVFIRRLLIKRGRAYRGALRV